MILDLFIYIIQFYINQNTFLPGFIIRKKGVLMINTSRGEIIDTNALIEGIENVIIG